MFTKSKSSKKCMRRERNLNSIFCEKPGYEIQTGTKPQVKCQDWKCVIDLKILVPRAHSFFG